MSDQPMSLILELDAYFKNNPARLPWGAISDTHCICTLHAGTVIEAMRVEGGIRLTTQPGEGTQVPVIDEVRPNVHSLMEVVWDRLVSRAEVEGVGASTIVKAHKLSEHLQRIRTYGTPRKSTLAAATVTEWQSGRIDLTEALSRLQDLSDTVIEKPLSPTGRRSLARKPKQN